MRRYAQRSEVVRAIRKGHIEVQARSARLQCRFCTASNDYRGKKIVWREIKPADQLWKKVDAMHVGSQLVCKACTLRFEAARKRGRLQSAPAKVDKKPFTAMSSTVSDRLSVRDHGVETTPAQLVRDQTGVSFKYTKFKMVHVHDVDGWKDPGARERKAYVSEVCLSHPASTHTHHYNIIMAPV